MEFIDDVVNLAIYTVVMGIVTTIVFGIIFAVGGAMIVDDKDDSNFGNIFGGTIIALFIVANIIGFIINVNSLFFS